MVSIEKINEQDINAIVAYVVAFRKRLYPEIDHNTLPKELANFKQTYIINPLGAWFSVFLEGTHELVGTISCHEYNYRYNDLFCLDKNIKTSEVGKLYIDPSIRRQGIATSLFNALREQTKKQGIQCFYLHTHHHLPGAKQFWLKMGFTIQKEMTLEDDGKDIIHMTLEL